jgi:hypothetical protein
MDPSICPSVSSTASPTLYYPTVSPTTVSPSIAPSISVSPTLSSTVFSTIAPTVSVSPTIAPTIAHTVSPTILPTLSTAFLDFEVEIRLDNVSSLSLSNADQTAVLQTTALYMQVSSNYLSYEDTIVASDSSDHLKVLSPFTSAVAMSLVAVIEAYIPLSSTSYSNAIDLYNDIEINLNAAVSSQEYTITLRSYDLPNLAHANVSTLPTYSSPVVIYPPTTNAKDDNSIVITVLSIIPLTILILTSIFAVMIRRNTYSPNMSRLQSIVAEAASVGLYCITWYFFMTAVLSLPLHDHGVITLLLSKLPTFSAWMGIVSMLLFPTLWSTTNHSLSLKDYLYSPALLHCSFMSIPDSTFYSGILIASVLDLKMIRYQPWKRTGFTDISHGYPTISCVRWCYYSDIAGSIIQIIGSIVILLTKERSEERVQDMLLLIFSSIYTTYSIFKVSMLMIGFDELRKVENAVLINMKNIEDGKEKIDELDINDHTTPSMVQINIIHGDLPIDDEIVDTEAIQLVREVLLLTTVQQLTRFIVEEAITELSLLDQSEVQKNMAKTPESPPFHAYETLEMLKQQVKELGEVPVEYMTLEEIRTELHMLFQQCNEGKPYNEQRLDYLLRCMTLNPQYRKEQEEEAKKWREESREFIEHSLETMRGFIPPFIFTVTEQSLVEGYGMNRMLVRRIFTKKCLWLVRMHPQDIEKLHEAELLGRFNPVAQNLDIVELAAVYAALPTTFHKDPFEKKLKWKLSIEEKLKEMYLAHQAKKLPKQKVRSDCYNEQPPLFSDRSSFHSLHLNK